MKSNSCSDKVVLHRWISVVHKLKQYWNWKALNTFYGNVKCEAKRNHRLWPPCWLVSSLINAEMASARNAMCHFAVLELSQKERDEEDWEHRSASSAGKIIACSEHEQLKPYTTKNGRGRRMLEKFQTLSWRSHVCSPVLTLWKAAAPHCMAKHFQI